jgi:adenylate cyclase
MGLSPTIQTKLRQWYTIIIIGVIAGLIFVVFSDGFKGIFYFLNGAIIGFIIAAVGGAVELFIFDTSLRRKKFYVLFLSRTLFFLFLVITVTFTEMVVARMIRDKTTFDHAINSPDFKNLQESGEITIAIIYILAIISIINFTRQMNRKLGSGVLMNFVTGRYYHPAYRQRIIMFLRILHSHEIIDKIGRVKFHQLIRDVMYDIASPVIRNRGRIYEYVEDEVVITWNMKKGLEKSHCIRTFFEALQAIREKKEKYYMDYGFVPQLKAALNMGKVAKGEIGDVKSQIVYHGDVMNTTSRILDECSRRKEDFLITKHMLDEIELPVIYKIDQCETVRVRGREKPVEIRALKEVEFDSIA